ncbi:MAG: gamma-glutamyltransferase family protein [Candidatus Dormiibacterota bacterium]
MTDGLWVPTSTRPVLMGTRHLVSAGHYLAAEAGNRILSAGGNAIDAGVATGVCINVLQCDLTNIGGVAPIVVYQAASGKVETISGLGWWPKRTDLDYIRNDCGGALPGGALNAVVPSAMDAWLVALERYGTKPLAEVLAPAIELASDGFAMHPVMHDTLSSGLGRNLHQDPAMATAFFRDGQLLPVGALVRLPELARTLELLVEAERGAHTRQGGIRAARDRFYTGDIGEAIASTSAERGGWLAADDLAEFHVEVEPALRTTYRGVEVFGCPPWCQGIVALETLSILDGYDLASLEPGGADAFHLIVEALKAAFADRDRYVGDPRFVEVPADGMLSPDYAARWRERIDLSRATSGMPEPGDPWEYSSLAHAKPDRWHFPEPVPGTPPPDTSYLCVVDQHGNAFSATPSDGIGGAAIVAGYGFAISERGAQSWGDPTHPSAVEPKKRPRLTPAPGMVRFPDGRIMPYGTPGNDVQPQAMVQFLVNLLDFGMDLQQAVEAPRLATYSFPASSHPHPYRPGLGRIESRVAADVVDDLRSRGHRLELWPEWIGVAGSLGAVLQSEEPPILHGAADPRRTAYVIGR